MFIFEEYGAFNNSSAYVVGSHQKCLTGAFVVSSHNTMFLWRSTCLVGTHLKKLCENFRIVL